MRNLAAQSVNELKAGRLPTFTIPYRLEGTVWFDAGSIGRIAVGWGPTEGTWTLPVAGIAAAVYAAVPASSARPRRAARRRPARPRAGGLAAADVLPRGAGAKRELRRRAAIQQSAASNPAKARRRARTFASTGASASTSVRWLPSRSNATPVRRPAAVSA